MLKPRKPLLAAGDTIVEVMIVLAVLGLAIGISYATANRSLLNARQAQENATATGHAQSQVELLRTLASLQSPPPSQDTRINTLYCIQPDNTATPPLKVVPAGFSNQYTLSSSTPCQINAGSFSYQYSIAWDQLADDTYKVVVIWPDVMGEGTDSVTLSYRVHSSP